LLKDGRFLRGFLVLMVASAGCAQSLRRDAEKAGVLIGTAVRFSQLSEDAYASSLGREFNMLEAEDAMKWRTLRPEAGSYDFRQGDELVRFALAHQMKVRGHCLAWGRDNPEWLAQGQFTPREMAHLLHEHIKRVMRHYKGRVFAWDVVNEALDENGEVRDSLWYNQPGIGLPGSGTSYIEQAFRWAHEADPQAMLFYNEAEGEGMNRKSEAIYAMVKDFKRRGVPIDGVGLQMHMPALDTNLATMTAELSRNIARLTTLGVQVHITELDVSVPLDSSNRARPEDLNRQAEVYRAIVRACLNNRGCTAIQTWGFTDKYSWIGSHSRGTRGQALPFDRAYQPKPAYRAMREELGAPHPHP
jgi:endo-1,4-beta-xylanase